MADIKKELGQILSAVYGEEVRSSIHNAIDKINQVVENEEVKNEAFKQELIEFRTKLQNWANDLEKKLTNQYDDLDDYLRDVAAELERTRKEIEEKYNSGEFQGIMGPTGPTGPQGPQGIQGERGAPGAQGPQGAKGDTGERGAQGIQGEQGPTGAQGIQGLKGDIGEQGPQGIQGERGPIGEQGETGESGVIVPVPNYVFYITTESDSGDMYIYYPDDGTPPDIEYDETADELYWILED